MVAVLGNARGLAFLMVGALVGVLAGFFVLSRMLSSAAAPAAPPPRLEYDGPIYRVKDRVYNLADQNARRYLKLAVALQFTADTDKYEKAQGEAYATALKEFELELAPKVDFIADTLTRIVSAKTMAQMLSPEGKEDLKREIMDQLNPELERLVHARIKRVFLTEFVVQ